MTPKPNPDTMSRRHCKDCGCSDTHVTPLSRRGLCYPCGERHAADAAREMSLKEGPYRERHTAARARMRAGGVIGYQRSRTRHPPSTQTQTQAALALFAPPPSEPSKEAAGE